MIRRNVQDVVIIIQRHEATATDIAYVRSHYIVAYCHRCVTPYRGILYDVWCQIVISNMSSYIWQSCRL